MKAVGALVLALSGLLPLAGGPFLLSRSGPGLRADAEALPFTHFNDASEEKYLVETMGGGVVVFDLEEDGDLDVYFVDGAPLSRSAPTGRTPGNRLFRNLGGGRFLDVTVSAGVAAAGYGMGACSGDADNDGDTDLYVTNFGPDVFFRNNGDGTFRLEAAGPGGEDEWSTSCSFVDLDDDGLLDLYVARYVDFSLENHKYCGLLRPGYRVYCEPEVYNGVSDALYWNDANHGEGWTKAVMDSTGGKGLGVVVADLVGDARPDVYVANDRTPNLLWANRGGRRLEEVALLSGVALSAEGTARAGMGVDAGDVDSDGFLDLVVTNFARESNGLFRALGSDLFVDDAAASGLAHPSFLPLGFGVNLWDVENDGDLDLYVANGHVTDNIELYQPDLSHPQPDQLFLNDGRGRFESASGGVAGDLEQARVSRGSAVADLDGDGRLELLVTHGGGPALVFWNEIEDAGASAELRLVGRRAARQPFGATVWVRVGDRRVRHSLRGGSSYLSQGSPWIHVGLGREALIDEVEVVWPAGRREAFPGPPVNERALLVEGMGETVESKEEARR